MRLVAEKTPDGRIELLESTVPVWLYENLLSKITPQPPDKQ
jgi:hypothetical protein